MYHKSSSTLRLSSSSIVDLCFEIRYGRWRNANVSLLSFLFCYTDDVGSIPIMHSKVQIFAGPTSNDFSNDAVKKCSVQRMAELQKEKVSFCFSGNLIFETYYTSLPFRHDLCAVNG